MRIVFSMRRSEFYREAGRFSNTNFTNNTNLVAEAVSAVKANEHEIFVADYGLHCPFRVSLGDRLAGGCSWKLHLLRDGLGYYFTSAMMRYQPVNFLFSVVGVKLAEVFSFLAEPLYVTSYSILPFDGCNT